MASGVSATEFEAWLTPRQAVQLLDSVFPNGSGSFISKRTLLERLRAGKVRAIAGDSRRSNQIVDGEKLYVIPPTDWGHIGENIIFWESGDLTFSRVEGYNKIEIRHFDVRFDPQAVRDIIALQANKQAPQTLQIANRNQRKMDHRFRMHI